MRRKTCKRDGCSKPLPPIAVSHGDPYCSTGCARIERGLNPDNAKPVEIEPDELDVTVEPAAGMAALHHGTYDPAEE